MDTLTQAVLTVFDEIKKKHGEVAEEWTLHKHPRAEWMVGEVWVKHKANGHGLIYVVDHVIAARFLAIRKMGEVKRQALRDEGGDLAFGT